MTDEWEVRLTLAVEPPPDEGTVHRIGTTQPVPWSGVGLAEGVQGVTRLALNYVSTPATPVEAVAQAFASVERALDRARPGPRAGDRRRRGLGHPRRARLVGVRTPTCSERWADSGDVRVDLHPDGGTAVPGRRARETVSGSSPMDQLPKSPSWGTGSTLWPRRRPVTEHVIALFTRGPNHRLSPGVP